MGAVVSTVALTVGGPELWVNLDGINGELRVELLPLDSDTALPGYSLNESVPLSVNRVDAQVAWANQGMGVERVRAGTQLRVVFHLLEARLYSFQFKSDDEAPTAKHCRVDNSSLPFWLDCGSGKALTLGANHVSNNCVGPGVDDGQGSKCATEECTCMTWDASINASAYRAATLGLYGSDAGWAAHTAARLADWGFNTAGAWSATAMEAQPGLLFAVVLDMGVNWVQTTERLFPDVFDPEWARADEGGEAIPRLPVRPFLRDFLCRTEEGTEA